MLREIKLFFQEKLTLDSKRTEVDNKKALHLAIAALMVEVAESDYQDTTEERDSIIKMVKQSFDLSDDETNEIVNLARTEHAEAVDYFQFTNLINHHYSATQRVDLIEKLWNVAFSDNNLDKHEEHVIRRIADLIHVAHSDFMKTKLKAQKRQ